VTFSVCATNHPSPIHLRITCVLEMAYGPCLPLPNPTPTPRLFAPAPTPQCACPPSRRPSLPWVPCRVRGTWPPVRPCRCLSSSWWTAAGTMATTAARAGRWSQPYRYDGSVLLMMLYQRYCTAVVAGCWSCWGCNGHARQGLGPWNTSSCVLAGILSRLRSLLGGGGEGALFVQCDTLG